VQTPMIEKPGRVMQPLFLLCLFMVFPGVSHALTRYVSTAGSDTGTCDSAGSPCGSIQYAIDRVGTTGEIRIGQGAYTENIDITPPLTDLTLSGGWNGDFSARTEDPALTVIDGGGTGIAVYVSGAIVIDLTVENLTVRNSGTEVVTSPFCNFSPCRDGAGIYVSPTEGSNVTLRVNQCRIEDSAADITSGIVVAGTKNTSPTTLHVYIDGLDITLSGSAHYAGLAFGINGSGSSLVANVRNVRVTGGVWGVYGQSVSQALLQAVLDGGEIRQAATGLYGTSWGSATASWAISNLMLLGAAEDGVYFLAQDGYISAGMVNNTVADSGRYGVYLHTAPLDGTVDPTLVDLSLRNGIVWGSGTKDVYLFEDDAVEDGETWVKASDSIIGTIDSYLGGPYTDEGGVISDDPLFIDAPGGDYHITFLSPAYGSASCDRPAGTRIAPTADFEGDPRPNFGLKTECDMGADEYAGFEAGFELYYQAYDFGAYGVNYGSPSWPLRLLNTGASPVNVTGMSFAGGTHFVADPGGITTCPEPPFTLAAGGNCSVGISMWPKSAGPLSDTFTATSNDPKALSVPIALTGTGIDGHPVTVSYGGNGTGNVSADPPGTYCSLGNCTWTFPTGTTPTLDATPLSGSVFTGWGGDCSGMTCALVMNGAKNVTAFFSEDQDNDGIPDASDNCVSTVWPVRTDPGNGTPLYSRHPWDGYVVSRGVNDPIKMHAVRFLTPMAPLDLGMDVIFRGGFSDCGFTLQDGMTEIPGPVDIVNGSAVFERVIVGP